MITNIEPNLPPYHFPTTSVTTNTYYIILESELLTDDDSDQELHLKPNLKNRSATTMKVPINSVTK